MLSKSTIKPCTECGSNDWSMPIDNFALVAFESGINIIDTSRGLVVNLAICTNCGNIKVFKNKEVMDYLLENNSKSK